ncbi:hypothetical protein ACLQ2W_13210 [Micromonospora sp. DT227]
MIIISRLPFTWFGYRLQLRGLPNERPRFVYRCQAAGCPWVSRLLRVDDASVRCAQHPGVGVQKVYVRLYSCGGCSQTLVYPHDFDADESRHVGPGQHDPRPLRTQ